MPPSFTLSNAVEFTDSAINANVGTKPGVYVLGPKSSSGGVTVRYVGRADDDLAQRLKGHEQKGKYSHFVFAHAPNAERAYTMECELYHEYQNSVSGQIHPAKPKGSNTRCPRCGN